MPFTQPNVVTNNLSVLNPEPNDVGGLTAPQLQALFDKFGVDFQSWFNTTHIAELASVTAGTSASERLGSAPISGISGSTIYAQLVSLLAVAQAAQAGAILPGTITDTMLSNLAGQIKDTMTKHLADEVDHVSYAVDSGVANAYAVTLSPAPTAYVDGMGVSVKVGNASTGASTLNVNALGAKPILDTLGNALTATNNLKSGLIYSFRYNATTGNFILQGKGGGGNATAAHLLLGDTATVDSGQITGTMPSKLAENLGTLGATLLNLVSNGSFENGATGWTLSSTASIVTTHPKFGGSNLRIASTALFDYQAYLVPLVANHKYYLCGWYTKTGGNTSIALYDSTLATNICQNPISADTANYALVSSYGTNTTYTSGKILVYGSSSAPFVSGMIVEWDGLTLIDLTAAFGAGLEPTQAQMDAIMTVLGGYYDGNALLTKIASGGYISNGVLGTPEVLLNDSNHISANILSGITDFGVTGTYSNIKSMQSGLVTYSGASPLYVNISSVDLTKAIVILSGTSQGTQPIQASVKATLSSTTQITLARLGTNALPDPIQWTVIEFNNVKSLQTGTTTLGTSQTEGTSTITAVNTSRTLLFFSFTSNETSNEFTGNVRGRIIGSTSVGFMYNCSSAWIVTVAWQVIEFN